VPSYALKRFSVFQVREHLANEREDHASFILDQGSGISLRLWRLNSFCRDPESPERNGGNYFSTASVQKWKVWGVIRDRLVVASAS
jgi:hypothetical protein